MHGFRILDHPADIGFEAFGATRAEVFANAARALTDLRVDLETVVARDAVQLAVRGSDWAGLLVNGLSEILYLEDAGGWLLCQFEFSTFEETTMTAVARGEMFHRTRHRLKGLVKAITYHQLVLEKQGDLWRAEVFVDV